MTDHVRSRLWFARVAVWSALSIAVLAFGIAFVRADGFPSRPVRIIVPLNPGAGVDIVARMVANGLSEQTGKSVVVENRSGGATLVGAEVVAQSEPDGHTLLFTPDDTFTILPHLSKSLAFDPNKELIPITGIAKIINIMFVNSTIPVKTLPELIDYARAHPGALSYGTNGQGSAAQLALETLKSRTKIDIVHVPYKGNAPALLATVSGEVQLIMIGYGSAGGFIQDGKLRPIVVTGSQRESNLPDLPTTAELGYPDVDVTTWLTIAAPAKTPANVVKQVNDAFMRVIKNPDMRKQIEDRNLVPTGISSEENTQAIVHRYKVNGEAAVRVFGARLEE